MDCRSEKVPKNINPKQNANFISRVFFLYVLKLFYKGYKSDLKEDDIYEPLSDYKSKSLTDDFEIKLKKSPSTIFRLLAKNFGAIYIILGIGQFIIDTAVLIAKPYAVGKFVAYFAPSQKTLSFSDAAFFGSSLIGLSLLNYLYGNHYQLGVATLAIKIRTIVSSMIYRKLLTLPYDTSCAGQIVTLITKDVYILELFVQEANNFWINILQFGIMAVVLYVHVGESGTVVVAFFVLLSTFQMYLGSRAFNIKKKVLEKADQRLETTYETLNFIKIIKMYTWETLFYKKMNSEREEEVRYNQKLFLIKLGIFVNAVIVAHVGFYLMISCYIYMGNILTPAVLYYMYFAFRPLSYKSGVSIPHFIHLLSQVVESTRRINGLFKQSSIQQKDIRNHATKTPKIVYRCKNFYLQLRNGELTIISGRNGIGKTHFLRKILGEIEVSDDNVAVFGRISYASQEPWLFPSTIKQNIIFSEKYDEIRYKKILEICDLERDLKNLPKGDQTIVEDNGSNLSGGQKERINLARAVYRDADIYLLDDCLANLDNSVSSLIFQKCFKEFLKDKLVVFVTTNSKYYKFCDRLTIFENRDQIKIYPNMNKHAFKSEIVNNSKAHENFEDEDADLATCENRLLPKSRPDNVYEETKKSGRVAFKTYKEYIKNGGIFTFCIFLVATTGHYVSFVYANTISSRWSKYGQEMSSHIQNATTNSSAYEEILQKYEEKEIHYAINVTMIVIFNAVACYAIVIFSKRVSINLHEKISKSVLNSLMKFFDQTFIGNILNRFSIDLNVIDETIPFIINSAMQVVVEVVGIVIITGTVNPFFLLPTAGLFLMLEILRYFCIPTTRNLTRLEASNRSPLVGQVTASAAGLLTIRTSNAESVLKDEFDRHQDLYSSTSYMLQCCTWSFAFGVDMFCMIFIAIIVIRFLIFEEHVLANEVGMVLSQAYVMTKFLERGYNLWTNIENHMTSIERVVQYVDLKTESDHGLVLPNWPLHGQISFENVSLCYGDERVLHNLNFSVKPGEKIAITGRTGSGKSSIFSILFRLYNFDGKIVIDGSDTKNLALKYLRSKISIVPQDSVLFNASIRDNIDPFGNYLDEEIWSVLKIVRLRPFITDCTLEFKNFSEFSVGQKHLICLARALIQNNKILVVDEVNANLDKETENGIVEAILSLKKTTVLMITHQETFLKRFDRVLVLDAGQIVSFQ